MSCASADVAAAALSRRAVLISEGRQISDQEGAPNFLTRTPEHGALQIILQHFKSNFRASAEWCRRLGQDGRKMLRSKRERVIQTLSYEAGGLAIATPLYMAVFRVNVWGSAGLMIALSVAVLIWTPIYNTVFDRLDLRFAQRIASDRPMLWRVVHAIGLEATTVFFTVPVVMLVGGARVCRSSDCRYRADPCLHDLRVSLSFGL